MLGTRNAAGLSIREVSMSLRSRRPLSLAAVAAAALVATQAPSGVAEAVPSAPSADGQAYYDIPLRAGQTPADVMKTGADVTEVKGGGVQVITDAAGASSLRDKGFAVGERTPMHAAARQRASLAEGTFYGGYHTPAAHKAHNESVAKAHPDLVKVHDIGDSYLKTKGSGGHDIQAVCITKDAANGCKLDTSGKPKMLLQAQIHARELSTGELAYKWIDELVTSTDPEITNLLDTREMWVVPMLNPDGVDKVASKPDNPLPHRKNMNFTAADESECGESGSSQAGVDLNRNSDFAWDANEGGPCDQTFPGGSAASEPETQAIQGLMTKIFPDARDDEYESPVKPGAKGTFLTLHSYSNLIIHPYSFTNDVKAPDASKLHDLGLKMAESNGYEVGTAGEAIGYTAPGGTDDWGYGRLGVPSYTFEVGGSGTPESCGGFFPVYSCMDKFWGANRGAFITAAKAADNPYAQARQAR